MASEPLCRSNSHKVESDKSGTTKSVYVSNNKATFISVCLKLSLRFCSSSFRRHYSVYLVLKVAESSYVAIDHSSDSFT